mgnify:CR=1 FL=1
MKKLLYSLLALPMLMVACGEEVDTPTPEPSKPTLELTSEATMEFEAEGGEGTITFVYDFTGAVENQENLNSNQPVVAIDCDAEWIDVANEVYAYATSFTFVVAPNEVEEPREAVVKASILDLSFEVTIKQALAHKTGVNTDYLNIYAAFKVVIEFKGHFKIPPFIYLQFYFSSSVRPRSFCRIHGFRHGLSLRPPQ